MAETILLRETNLKNETNNFLFYWHRFTIDFWWRRKYNIPFGSSKHREMNFIDMFIEFQEEININDFVLKENESEDFDEEFDLNYGKETNIKLSKEEIDKDFEDLDLNQFDKE